MDPTQASTLVPYISPTLQRLAVGRPNPSPACATCPASMWYITPNEDDQKELRCFCSRMHVTTWDDKLQPIIQCDGRDLALMEIALQQAEKEERKAERAADRAAREADRKTMVKSSPTDTSAASTGS